MYPPLKQPEEDPQKKLGNARGTANRRWMRGPLKDLLGDESANDRNGALDQAQADSGSIRKQQWLAQNGLDATAEVLAIIDTGTMFKTDPVVSLTVKIQPAMIAVAFETTGRTTVSRAAFPQVGDRIKIRYNPANPTQFVALY